MQQKRSQPTLPHFQDTSPTALMSLDNKACNSASNASSIFEVQNQLRVLALFSCRAVLPLSLHSLGPSRTGNVNLWCTISLTNPLPLIRMGFPLRFSSTATKTPNQPPTQRRLCHVALQAVRGGQRRATFHGWGLNITHKKINSVELK